MVMMQTTGFSAFPAGLRVLVVDDDPTWLKILEKMLKKCSYQVTTCGLAREALRLLRERKDGFDIVISDVNMPDMDGFKLLEHVGLEMDLPVIMMSVDGETSRVMKGVHHGACDYLLKPIRMKELRNIWQHVLRKRMHEERDVEFIEDRTGTDHWNEFYFWGDQTSAKRRKNVEFKDEERESSDVSCAKRARVVWSVDLHQKFVQAVNQIGFDKVGPKKILDLMNVPWLTRENVASHLQKYRLYLSRLRKENESETSFVELKNSDHSLKDSNGTFSFQNSTAIQQINYDPDPSKLEIECAGADVFPLPEHNEPFHGEVTEPIALNHRFGSLEHQTNYGPYDVRDPVAPERATESFSTWFDSHGSVQASGVTSHMTLSMKNLGPSLCTITGLDFKPRNQTIGSGLWSGFVGEDLRFCCVEEDKLVTDPGFSNNGFSDYELSKFGFESEYLYDSVEYPVIE